MGRHANLKHVMPAPPCWNSTVSGTSALGSTRALRHTMVHAVPLRPLTRLQVVMEAGGEQQEVWLSRKQLKGQDELLRGFVRKLRE